MYIVTGATGFLGNTVVKMLLERGETVRGFARSEDKVKLVYGDGAPEIVYGDVRKQEDVDRLLDGAEGAIVIHTAAIVSIGDKQAEKEMPHVNIDGTRILAQACVNHGVKRLVHVSSVHAIPEKNMKGRPIREVSVFTPDAVVGAYAKTKATATDVILTAVREQNLDAVIVHPSGIIGPGDYGNTHMSQMMIDFAEGRIPASVKGAYDFVDVRDVATGILSAVDNGRQGECYLLTGHDIKVTDLLALVAKETGRKVPATLPMWVAKMGLPFLQLYAKIARKRPLYTAYSLYTLRSNHGFVYEKASKEFGYQPRSTAESVRDQIAFSKEQGFIKK